MYHPLLQGLKAFKHFELPAGTRLFHGCREKSLHTNLEGQLLDGRRKWLSQSAVYAVNYAYSESAELGKPLLWVCELAVPVPSLQGSQISLKSKSPWDDSFPWEFPNAFEEYAKEVLAGTGARALLDHSRDGIYGEILLTQPAHALRVAEIVGLPQDLADAVAIAKYRFNC